MGIVDGIQSELFESEELNRLLDFLSHVRNPMHSLHAGYMPPAFSEVRKMQGSELYDALSRLEYRTRNSRAGLGAKLVFPGKGGWAYGKCRDLEKELNPNECMNMNAGGSFVVLAQIGYAIWPAVVGVCVGFRDKNTGDVKALAGIADYACQPGFCKTAVERDADGIGQGIINQSARELSEILR